MSTSQPVQPVADTIGPEELWRRLGEALQEDAGGPTPAAASDASEPASLSARTVRIHWRVLDVLGLTFWIYVLARVFVGDADRWLVSTLAPSLQWALDYRLLLFLAAVAVVAALARRWWWVAPVYVFGFPLVVLLWKTPVYLIRHRSWPLLLGILQALSSFFKDFRYNIVTKTLAAIAASLILFARNELAIAGAALYIGVLMLWSLVRRIRRLLSNPSFIEFQIGMVRRAVSSKSLKALYALQDEYKRVGSGRYSRAQAQQVAMWISTGIAFNKILYLWAYQVDNYRRRYSPGVVFNLASYAWVFVMTLLGLWLLNLALLQLQPDQYLVPNGYTWMSVLSYSLGTLATGGGAGIEPRGDLALALHFCGSIAGVLILAGLLFNIFLVYSRERDDRATQDLIEELHTQAAAQEAQFQAEYSVTVDEAYRRLAQFGDSFVGVAAFVVRAAPNPMASTTPLTQPNSADAAPNEEPTVIS